MSVIKNSKTNSRAAQSISELFSDFYFEPLSKIQFSAVMEWNLGNLSQFEENPEHVPCIFKAEDETSITTPPENADDAAVVTVYKRQLYLVINIMHGAQYQVAVPALCFRVYKDDEIYLAEQWAVQDYDADKQFVSNVPAFFEIVSSANSINLRATQIENNREISLSYSLSLALPEADIFPSALPFQSPLCWGYKNSGSYRLSKLDIKQLHIWQDNNNDLYSVILNNEDVRPYVTKQLPMQNLTAYYPLYTDFTEFMGKELILQKEMKNTRSASLDFDNSRLFFDSQQMRFRLPFDFIETLDPATPWFTLSFWMNINTDDIVWLSDQIEDILLFELYKGQQSLLSVHYRYDETELKPLFTVTSSAPEPVVFTGKLDEWGFFSLSYNNDSKTLFVSYLNSDDDQDAVETKTTAIGSTQLDGSCTLFWGGKQQDFNFEAADFSGKILALSEITLFTNCSLYEGLQTVFEDFTINNIDKTNSHYNTSIMHLLNRGANAMWNLFFANYLKHKADNSIE
jgi:hypothetical protein